MPSFSPFKSKSAVMALLSLSTSSLVILPYFFKRPLLISALTFSICALLGNIPKRTFRTVSPQLLTALKKSLNCMGFNMSLVKLSSKISIRTGGELGLGVALFVQLRADSKFGLDSLCPPPHARLLGMRIKKSYEIHTASDEIVGHFGQVRLVRKADGKYELVGGTTGAQTMVRNWCGLYAPFVLSLNWLKMKLCWWRS
jgi:hypothetical protein